MTVKEKDTVSGNTNMIPFTKRLLIPSQIAHTISHVTKLEFLVNK